MQAADSVTDFDFIIGAWRVQHRRLNERFVNCTEWTEFYGDTTTFKVLQGYGNVEDNCLHFPSGDVKAVALRSFDVSTGKWAIWWLDGRAPHQLDVPVIGEFDGNVGTFLASDVIAGIPTIVKFNWYKNPGENPRWEQAFSQDGGNTWEVNWVMEFSKVSA